jgi:universal stress protein E
MLSISKALVIIDPESEKHVALERVLQWDRVSDLSIELVAGESSDASLLEEYLEQIASPLREQGVDIFVTALQGNPNYESLVRHICHVQPDIVFHSVRYHQRLAQQCLSNQDWQLVRACPAPLLLVRDRPWQKTPRVLAAIDPLHHRDLGATLDYRIIAFSHLIQQTFGGDVMAIHSYSPTADRHGQFAERREKHQEVCKQVLSSLHLPQDKLVLLDGALPASMPPKVRELNPDVVVMGAVSRSRLDDPFIGSTAEQVIDDLNCDVLIVKPEVFESPILALPQPVAS